jgi:hypothetical protein
MQAFADKYGVTVVYTQSGRRGMPVGEPQVKHPRKNDEKAGGCSK